MIRKPGLFAVSLVGIVVFAPWIIPLALFAIFLFQNLGQEPVYWTGMHLAWLLGWGAIALIVLWFSVLGLIHAFSDGDDEAERDVVAGRSEPHSGD